MAFVPICEITITQVSTSQYPGRDKIFTFNFLADYSGQLTWAHLTDTIKITIPRKIYFLDGENRTTWAEEQIYGNPEKAPLIIRGDKIKVTLGYQYFKPTSQNKFKREIVTDSYTAFDGYITKIQNKTPVTLECEDKMYALKQTKVEDKVWSNSTYTLEKMLKEMISKSTFSDTKNIQVQVDNYKHDIGKFITKGVTIAQVLDELRKHYHLESFIRDNTLRCGIIRYYPEDRANHVFHFQKNIISDNLEYQRADDVRIGIIAKSIYKIELQTINSSGKKKTAHKQLEVRVGDLDGELRTLFFENVTTTADLKKLAEAKLPFVRYEGFKGSFTTFGLPQVKHGDSVYLQDDLVPERSGTYLVKQVNPSSGMFGIRQEIFLDIRIDGLSTDELAKYQSNGI
jgi:hypothetical protein